ncbi:hypothetical protein GO755_25615 [Spirosoma sp. HMF4905]|uniref:Lipoprotein n=1 Tax=Spirosoma arboris TaxID=2682092 RepID=A0A7K1SI00_9BACT|nr:hypothetical protein [Spirosoma arboris]MVM33440.1 hypothetical protein [Spirosoma arboris]
MLQTRTFNWVVLRYAFILSLSLTVTACFTEPQYSNVPQIEFKGLSRYTLEGGSGVGQQKRDSLVITIGFKDGDGDLGNNIPLSSLDSGRYTQAGGWGNYRITAYRLENDQYQAITSGENTTLYFPQLSREGQKGAIEGSLDLHQIYHYGTSYKNYVTKYRIQIRDRNLHVSNEIETDTITVPYSIR